MRSNALGSLSINGLRLLQLLIFTRLAGPIAAGEYALAASVIAMGLPFAEAGIGTAFVQAEDIRPGQAGWLLGYGLLISALFYALLWCFAPMISAALGQNELQGLLRWCGLVWLITPFQMLWTGALQRWFRFRSIAVMETASWMGSVVVVGYLAWLGWGAWSMAVGLVFRPLLICIAAGWSAGRKWTLGLLQLSPWSAVKGLLRLSSVETSSRIADHWSNHLDKLIVGHYLGAEILGFYNLAFVFLVLPSGQLGYAISRVGLPVFSRLKYMTEELSAFYNTIARDTLFILIPVYSCVISLAPELILFLFGEAWLPAVPFVQVLALAGWARAFHPPLLALLRGLGKPQWILVGMGVMVVFANALLVVAMEIAPQPIYVAWAHVVSAYTIGLLLYFYGLYRAGVFQESVAGFALINLIFSAGPMLFTFFVGGFMQEGSTGYILAIKFAVFCGLYAWWFFLGPYREILKKFLK